MLTARLISIIKIRTPMQDPKRLPVLTINVATSVMTSQCRVINLIPTPLINNINIIKVTIAPPITPLTTTPTLITLHHLGGHLQPRHQMIAGAKPK